MAEIIITSSVLILALLLIRKICWGKISRRMQYGLWILVVIRLLVPAQFLTSPISIMQLVEHGAQQEILQAEKGEQLADSEDDAMKGIVSELPKEQDAQNYEKIKNGQGQQTESAPITATGDNMQQNVDRAAKQDWQAGVGVLLDTVVGQLESILLGIYITGTLVIAGVLLACNIRFRRMLYRKRKLIGQEGRLKVYLVEGLDSPCMCGVLAPAIYMNATGLVNADYTKHILAHEVTHYKHGDHIWTSVRSLCLTLYWFHPLVWMAAIISAKDGELACDEGTLKRLGEENRHAYGCTLIEMTAARGKRDSLFYCATGMANHKKEIKQRITVIADNRKPMLGTAVAVIMGALLLVACTGGTGKEESVHNEQIVQNNLSSEAEELPNHQDAFLANEDGSYRLSEYQVELTGDKISERIVFDVYYWADLENKAEVITEELLWNELWNGCEVMARVLNGEDERVLWEHSYSDAHAGNGNLAVVKYQGQNCLMRYHNLMYQGSGQLFYQILQLQASGGEPVILEEGKANYEGDFGTYEEDVIVKVLEVAEELDKYLTAYNTDILVNASINRENCYLHGSKQGLLNGVRRQTAFDVFIRETGGNGWELNLQDFFYPEGMESLTVLPEDAEARIRAGEILCMEVSPDNTTAGRLDLDGDGKREVLYLYGVSEWFNGTGWHFWSEDHGIIDEKYRLRVNGQYYEDYCDMMDPVLMAYSPDGEQILLAVYDDGPSNDPATTFFRYDTDGVHLAGSISADLREVTIDENGVIKGTIRADMIQTEWAYGYYIWNGREIVMREDEVYYLLDDRRWRDDYNIPLLLLEEITVYAERSEDSRAMLMKPQEVSHVATDRQEWVLLEATDGTKGWLRVEQWKVPQLENKSVFEVFEGLYMAD